MKIPTENNGDGTPRQKFVMQLLLVVVGVTLILTRDFWAKPLTVLLAGIFFLNLCWVTLVLGYDLKIWAWLRNNLVGNLFLMGVILANFVAIIVSVFLS